MNVVGIPYICLFANFILPLINVYSMWCALSYSILILTENVCMIRINLFISFNYLNLIIIYYYGGQILTLLLRPGKSQPYRP